MNKEENNQSAYGTNWNNIDLNSAYERSLNILNAYSFEDLLLEINCNLRDINEATVTKQFNESVESKINCMKEVFEANLKNIVKEAQKTRNEK